ncbi:MULTISPECIES: hypothetical protein [Amycolatopsis]|uniref:hypothetical protein n=1 Tax=Amycolatopsis TaxID=1813 RepID=UPI0033BFACA3
MEWPAFAAWSPETWSAFANLLTAAIAALAATIAWRQVREAKRLRQDQADPYVAAFLEFDASTTTVDLVVKNFGNTSAFNIKITTDPPLKRTGDDNGAAEEVILPETIRTLVPGQEWRTLLDFGFARANSDLPKFYTATVSFTSQGAAKIFRRNSRKSVPHRYEFSLDLGALDPIIFVKKRGLHDIAKEVENISKAVRLWGEGVGTRGLRVFTRDGDTKDERRQQDREARLAQVEAALQQGVASATTPPPTPSDGSGSKSPSETRPPQPPGTEAEE